MGKTADISIDLMKREDMDQVMAIERASFSVPWSVNLFHSEFRSRAVSTLLVSLADTPIRTVTGYIVFWVIQDEMHILNLAVAPARRRQGIAKRLVLDAIRRAYHNGARRAFLEVRVSNSAAQRLYTDLGFSGTSIRRDYYEAPAENAIVMTLETGALLRIAKGTDPA